MYLMQNFIILLTSFLLSRLLIEAELHKKLIFSSQKTANNLLSIQKKILYTSFALSIFLPNTIVVLSLLPIINRLLQRINEINKKKKIGTLLGISLIFGANIGGMSSMTGASSNIFLIAYIAKKNIIGSESINFFNWLIIGIPFSLSLVFIASLLLKVLFKPQEDNLSLILNNDENVKFNKAYMIFFIINILFIFSLSGLQNIFKPKPFYNNYNYIDLIFIFYLIFMLVFCFIWPKGKSNKLKKIVYNFKNLIIVLILSPLILLSKLIDDIEEKFQYKIKFNPLKLCNQIFQSHNQVKILFTKRRMIKDKNPYNFISINLFFWEIPMLGLLFLLIVISVIVLVLKIGDNPSTKIIDGYIYQWITHLAELVFQSHIPFYIIMFTITLLTLFLTEIINNSTVIIIFFSIIGLSVYANEPQGLLLLAIVTISSTAAFMSPLASPVNAITFGGLKSCSLKNMLKAGFYMNLTASIFIYILALFFLYLIS